MSEKPISPLRQRMLEDMSMRRFVPDTQREYIGAVKRLATFLGRSPDTATPEELRAFCRHSRRRSISISASTSATYRKASSSPSRTITSCLTAFSLPSS
jgi:integrase/recombinase XerD